jgi:hypothetical protein
MCGDAGAEKTAETGESKYCKSPALALHISRLFFPMVDQPTAALVMDLKQRGLLGETAVAFGSEFGQTPFAQGALKANFGRDHHGGNVTA